jgi:UDP-N-acetylmuramoyl-tripeptide--D-alanyl-D-alanine ligase
MDIKPKYALIGEIGEIEGYESAIYDDIIGKAKSYPRIMFIMSGQGYAKYKSGGNITIAVDENETLEHLRGILSGAVLVKASRSYSFEKYINVLKTGAENAL